MTVDKEVSNATTALIYQDMMDQCATLIDVDQYAIKFQALIPIEKHFDLNPHADLWKANGTNCGTLPNVLSPLLRGR